MLLPDKHITLAESIFGLGAFLLDGLERSTTLDRLYLRVREAMADRRLPAYHDFDSVLLAIGFLYSVGLIEQTESGGIKRCGS